MIAVLVALATGAAIGIAASPVTPPGSLAGAQPLVSVAVTPLEYRDPRAVSVTVTTAPAQSLRSPVGGLLTSFPCTESGTVSSVSALFSVDGVAVLGLATATPLWRDLDRGDEGPDVAAVQAELVRLGKGLTIDGVWGRVDATALAEVMAAAGSPTSSSRLELRRIAWLPAPSIQTSACLLGTGSTVAPGEALAEFPVIPSAARVAGLPSDAVPGPRVIAVGEREHPLPADGIITDPAALADIVASTEYRQARAESETDTLELDDLLAAPVATISIPPSALIALDGTRGCVLDKGRATKVEVVASQLGQTLVIADRTLRSVDLHPDPDASCP